MSQLSPLDTSRLSGFSWLTELETGRVSPLIFRVIALTFAPTQSLPKFCRVSSALASER